MFKQNTHKTMTARLFSLLMLGLAFGLSSCEDVIDVNLEEGESQLSVDAFLTDEQGEQRIVLTKSSAYFANTLIPATGATVVVTDDQGGTFNFTESAEAGVYTYTPDSTGQFAVTGNTYNLAINYEGLNWTATSTVAPVPVMDSLTYEFREGELGEDEGFYVTFFATDIPGSDDFYWIRTYRNGEFWNDPDVMNLSQNGAFTGDGADGFLFIIPIRESLVNDGGDPYVEGESVRVELMAISENTWSFLAEAQENLTNNGLFAIPPYNVRSNIQNADASSSTEAVGWFSVSAVSAREVVIGQ